MFVIEKKLFKRLKIYETRCEHGGSNSEKRATKLYSIHALLTNEENVKNGKLQDNYVEARQYQNKLQHVPRKLYILVRKDTSLYWHYTV